MAQGSAQLFSIRKGSALLLLALLGAVSFASVSRLARQQEAVIQANTTLSNLDILLVASGDAERAGTEFALHGWPRAADDFSRARSEVESALDVLRAASEDRPQQRLALDSLGPLVGERFRTLADVISVRRREGAAAAAARIRDDTTRTSRGGMLPLMRRIRDEELVVLAERTRLMEDNGRSSKAIILGGSIAAFLLAAIALAPMRPPRAE